MTSVEIEKKRLAAIERDRWVTLVYVVMLLLLAIFTGLSWSFGSHALSLAQISRAELHRVSRSVSSVAKRQTHGIGSIGTALCAQRKNEFEWFTGLYAVERKYWGSAKDAYHIARLERYAKRAAIEGTSFDFDQCVRDFEEGFPSLTTPPPDTLTK